MRSTEKMSATLDLRGLDMVTPVDLLSDGRTPYSKNFRLYAQQSDDRRVAVSSRKGPGFYVEPLAETLSDSQTAVTGASTTKVGIVTGITAIPFTAASTDRITRIDIHVADLDDAYGPLMVEIWSDVDGLPGTLLSTSSISSGDIGLTADYQTARFTNAVQLVDTDDYWIVLRIQDDGGSQYTLSTTTDGDACWTSDSTLTALTEEAFAVNYKIFTAVDGVDKGAYRFNREDTVNRTLVAYGTTMYYVDEATNTLLPLIDGLSASADDYAFTNADNKVFWVNSFDDLTAWNGTFEDENPNLVDNGSFDTDLSGWVIDDAEVITRDTGVFASSPASMKVTAGYSEVNYDISLPRDHRYKLTFKIRGVSVAGTGLFRAMDAAGVGNDGALLTSATMAFTTTEFTEHTLYFDTEADAERIKFESDEDFYLDDVSIVETGVEYIRDSELPILSEVVMHKDRMWGVDAADKNKLVFSENPGNPAFNAAGTIATTAREQWYHEWLSISYWYVPRPYHGSPITKLLSFQDSLTIFTQDGKYTLTGYDRGSLYMRESNGSKGAISRRGVTSDENKIYFVGEDGFYEYNGSSDTKISALINPLFDGCGQKDKITPVQWKNQVRFYMASAGSPVNDSCVIFDKDMEEMLLDTGTYVNRAISYKDADDDNELIEFSSLTPVAYNAEQDYNDLGAPIDFEYRLKYDSMKTPMQKKRLKRFYPILQGVDSTFPVQLSMDKDFEDSPKIKEQQLVVSGSTLGSFNLGDGTILGGNTTFKPKRQSYSGYAYYWQLRVARKGVNNRVAFVGAQFSYKTKRL